MKKLHWIFWMICLVMVPALQSCDDDEHYSLGDFTRPLWATMRVTGNAFYLECDEWGKLWPVNTDLGWYEPTDGQRVIAVFNPIWDNYQGYDHAVKILSLQNVLTKSVEVLTTENDAEFGNDPMTILKGQIGISGGYMNLFFIQNLPEKQKHRISLVRPELDSDCYGADGYIHLELRYNNYGDVTGIQRQGAVSFNLNSLNFASDCKGIKLKINSSKNGEVELTFDRKAENNVMVDNLNLTELQLK